MHIYTIYVPSICHNTIHYLLGESSVLDLSLQFVFLRFKLTLSGNKIFHSISESGTTPDPRRCWALGSHSHGLSSEGSKP